MNIAVFGDLHGRVLLAFHLCRLWQEKNGKTIDAILCTGDVGVFRSAAQLDKASRRFAERYPEELGFSKFFFRFEDGKIRPHPAADEVLEEVKAKLFFVSGNHEEHSYIWEVRQNYASSEEDPVALDLDWKGMEEGKYARGEFKGYERILNLHEGSEFVLRGDLDQTTWQPSVEIHVAAINGLEKYTMPDAYRSIVRLRDSELDILLTHETFYRRLKTDDPHDRRGEFGSEKLRECVLSIGPKVHFFGHHHEYYPEREYKSYGGKLIRSVGLNQLMFRDKNSAISQNAFGVLVKTALGEAKFEIVNADWYNGIYYGHVACCL